MVLVEEQKPTDTNADSPPPSYDAATHNESIPRDLDHSDTNTSLDAKSIPETEYSQAPSYVTDPQPQTLHAVSVSYTGEAPVYKYTDPYTKETFDSLLPPEHDEMLCMKLGHAPRSMFGIGGILGAIFTFPFGWGFLFCDRDVVCHRCHKVLRRSGKKGGCCKGKQRAVEYGGACARRKRERKQRGSRCGKERRTIRTANSLEGIY